MSVSSLADRVLDRAEEIRFATHHHHTIDAGDDGRRELQANCPNRRLSIPGFPSSRCRRNRFPVAVAKWLLRQRWLCCTGFQPPQGPSAFLTGTNSLPFQKSNRQAWQGVRLGGHSTSRRRFCWCRSFWLHSYCTHCVPDAGPVAVMRHGAVIRVARIETVVDGAQRFVSGNEGGGWSCRDGQV